MKKIILSLLTVSLFSLGQLHAQRWVYDFGTGTTKSYTSTAVNNSYAPSAASGGGSTMVRGSNGGGGSVTFANQGTVGTGAELNLVASTNTSANKFGIFGYTADKVATTKFKMKFSDHGLGRWYFMQGSGADLFNGASIITSAFSQVFTGLEFVLQTGTPNSVIINNRVSGYPATGSWVVIKDPNTPANNFSLTVDVVHTVEVYMNNSTALKSYTRGVNRDISPNKYDLWIDNVLIASNLAKANLPDDTSIDSFGFYTQNPTSPAISTTDRPYWYIDDVIYANYIAQTPLPVSLTSFTGKANGSSIDLSWATAAEQNNKEFNIFRSTDKSNFTKITTVNGSGTTSSPKNYSYRDTQPFPGTNYYKLVQVDNDGATMEFKDLVAVKSSATASNFKIVANKANGTIDLNIYAAIEGNSPLVVYDLNGRKLINTSLKLNKGYNNISLPSQNTAEGLQIASLTIGNEVITNKFIR